MRSFTVPHHTTIRKAALLLVFSLIIAMYCLGAPAPAQAATIDKCLGIDSDETWTLDNVYRVYCDVVVMSGVTLTIQAGTVVKFDGSPDDLSVIGTLDVQGTASNPVVFTSYKDDFYGGDTNGDDDATSPAPGDWGSIWLRNSANTLDYAIIQYGGGGDNYGNAYGGVYILDASPTVSNTIIRDNDLYSIYVDNGSPTINNNTIQDSTQYGMYVNSGSPTISNNTFTDSGTRHLAHGANADPTYTGNTFSGTGAGAIDIFGDSLSSDVTWGNVQGLDWPYLVFSDLTISSAGTLRLPAGIVVKFNYSLTDLIVYGTLDVQGTASNRVVFTSYRDDSNGGDTNGDGTATSPGAGNWGSIHLRNSASILDYTIIQYGGGAYGGVYIKDSSPTVEHNLIHNNENGIVVSNGSPAIKDNEIKDSSNYGLSVSTGSPTVSDNTFTDSGNRHLSHGANAEPAYSGNTFSGTGGGTINTSGGYISSDITWENVQGLNWPYHLRSDLTINSDGTLRLPAGTVVKFNSSETNLYVKGVLDVQGTASNRVVFTSYLDDSYGGDTNGDGAATTPAAGDWGSIRFRNSANTLDYTLIQYGGIYGSIYIENSSPTVEYNIIHYNNYGIYVDNGSPTIRDNNIEESSKSGLHVYIGSPAINNNNIEDSSLYGLRVVTGSPTVTDNTFTDSGTRHLYHGANADPTYAGNTFSGTGGGAIDVFGDSISRDITWENIQGLNWPYLLLSDITINSDNTLTIQAGTVIKFETRYNDLIVEGTLDVQGTASNRVVFTSYQDDSYGGDTNGDGAATTPAPGDWGSIKFRSSPNTLDYTLIQYGGKDFGGVFIDNCSPTLDHNIIRYNNNGINVGSGSPIIRNNDITGTTNYGVYNHSNTTIDAVNNWWGHASGPSGVGPGSGDAVGEHVNYTPWLEAPANPSSDTNPPSSITDLKASAGSEPGTVNLSWSAPGDDGGVGTASAYIVRYANSIINSETAWGSAMDVSGEPTPSESGSAENMVVSGLNPGTTYYFAVRSQDEVPNLSGISNSPSATPLGGDPGTASTLTYLPYVLR